MQPTSRKLSRSIVALSALFSLALAGGSTAFASVITNSPSLPPNAGSYQSGGAHATYNYGGIPIDIQNVSHTPNAGSATQDFSSSPGNEIDTFPSTVTGQVSVNGSPYLPFLLSDSATQVEVFGRTSSNELGTFNTQMLNLDLTGNVGGHSVEIKLDPSIPTTGQTTISDQGGGLFRIDSFFDVFTEISLDNGPFIPQSNGPTLVTLQPLPEPGSLTLLALGASSALVVTRRRRRSPH